MSYITGIVLSAVGCVVHIIGFLALWKVRSNNSFMIAQRWYLLNLSVVEGLHSLFLVLFNLFFLLKDPETGGWMFILGSGVMFCWDMTILIMFTLARLFNVCDKDWKILKILKKTKLVLGICFLLAIGLTVGFILYTYLKGFDFEQSLKLFTLYIWFPLDIIFILVAVVTYPSIIVMLGRNDDHRAEQTLTSTSGSENNDEDSSGSLRKSTLNWKKFLVPVLLIFFFLGCVGIPDFIYFFYHTSEKDFSAGFRDVSFILYSIRIIADAFLYVLLSKDVRQYLKKKLCCHTDKKIKENRIDKNELMPI